MVRHPRRLSAVTFVVFAVLSLGGCSTSDGGSSSGPSSLMQIADDARSAGHEWQANLLDDGEVTLAEYDEGHRRNLECLTNAGMTFTDPVRILTDGFRWDYAISWAGMDDSAGQTVSERCFEDNLGALELAMASWGDWRTDPALLSEISSCVSAAGFSTDIGSRNYRDVWLEASDEGLTPEKVSSCAGSAMNALYPGVGYAITF